jgi:ribosomal protein L11 methyltransferase
VPTWALHTELDLEEAAIHRDALERAGLLGMAEVEGRAVISLREHRDDLGVAGRWEEVADEDWSATWRAGLDAVRVGPLVVTPPWLPHDDDAIVIDPGQAFGTGHHETTTGCLAALAALDLAGRSVLDVGTGTGVLAIAADRLGAGRVVAVEIDPVAVAIARQNIALNAAEVEVLHGSASAAAGGFDVVVANLDTATVTALAGDLAQRLAPAGALIASGVSIERAGEAVAALAAAGLAVEASPGTEWVVLRGVHADGAR